MYIAYEVHGGLYLALALANAKHYRAAQLVRLGLPVPWNWTSAMVVSRLLPQLLT